MVKTPRTAQRFGRRTASLLSVGVVLAVAGITTAYWGHRRPVSSGPGAGDSSRHHRSVRHEIQGFRFDGQFRGHRVLTITADRFAIRKKKLGVFRFGLMNEARFENAVIRLYGSRKDVFPDSTCRPAAGENGRPDGRRPVRFDGVFSGGALPSLPTRRLASLEFSPVTVELGDEQSVVTRISAASAVVRPEKKDILFQGKVRMATDERVLYTDRLRLLPLEGTVSTDRSFRLTGPDGRLKGRRMAADLLLQPVRYSAGRSGGNQRQTEPISADKTESERQSNR